MGLFQFISRRSMRCSNISNARWSTIANVRSRRNIWKSCVNIMLTMTKGIYGPSPAAAPFTGLCIMLDISQGWRPGLCCSAPAGLGPAASAPKSSWFYRLNPPVTRHDGAIFLGLGLNALNPQVSQKGRLKPRFGSWNHPYQARTFALYDLAGIGLQSYLVRTADALSEGDVQ
jgi:hypothetical protein